MIKAPLGDCSSATLASWKREERKEEFILLNDQQHKIHKKKKIICEIRIKKMISTTYCTSE